ncbi:MAG: DUF3224 domain-containing protein [Deltaproteobacteria bacterium]|nr:DUF3224 domain-containing protein [Deltaproteobacteria bacterium]
MRVRGPFDVELKPIGEEEEWGGFGRLGLDKRFHGPLEGTSRGQMIAARTEIENSAAYVAVERVTATLQGRAGTFVLVHQGLMDRGRDSLRVIVVPDSGTGALAGISGTMNIVIEPDGSHFYELDYVLPER